MKLREKKGSSSGDAASEVQWARATQWISRTLAVVLVMVAPGVLGSVMDKHFETNFLALLGFAIGLALGTVGLLVLAKRFTPAARGSPLSWDGEDDRQPDSDEDAPPKNGS